MNFKQIFFTVVRMISFISCSVAHIPPELVHDLQVHSGNENINKNLTDIKELNEGNAFWDIHQPEAEVYGSGKVHTHFGDIHGYEKNMFSVYMILLGFMAYLFLLLFDALSCWSLICKISGKKRKNKKLSKFEDYRPVLVTRFEDYKPVLV